MKGSNVKGIIAATCLLMLAGCGSSPEDKLYEAFKCGKVATLLEHEKDANMALVGAEPYMKQMEAQGGNPAQVAMEMNQRFQDDVPLYRLTPGGQLTMLSNIYQSDECQALYKPASEAAGVGRLTEAGDINLAGCEVPAGLTPEQAERVECASSGSAAVPEPAIAAEAEVMPASATSQDADLAAAAAAAAAAANAVAAANDAANLGAGQAGTSDAEVIKAAISARAAQDGGSEYTDARRSVEGDLNEDGAADVAVLYSLEGAGGGNGSVGYLAAFVRTGGQLKLADTATLAGSAQSIKLKDGAVHLKLLSLGPDDSACCPSAEEDAMYILHGNKWLQVQAQP